MRQQLALGQSPLDEVVTDDRREAAQRRSGECCNRANNSLVHDRAFKALCRLQRGTCFNQFGRIAMSPKNSATKLLRDACALPAAFGFAAAPTLRPELLQHVTRCVQRDL